MTTQIEAMKLSLAAHREIINAARENAPPKTVEAFNALRAAIKAAEKVEPVAWLYEHDGMVHDASNPDLISTTRWASCKEPWTETALYSHPAQPAGEREK